MLNGLTVPLVVVTILEFRSGAKQFVSLSASCQGNGNVVSGDCGASWGVKKISGFGNGPVQNTCGMEETLIPSQKMKTNGMVFVCAFVPFHWSCQVGYGPG